MRLAAAGRSVVVVATGLLGACGPAHINFVRVPEPTHICPGDPVVVSYDVRNTSGVTVDRNGVVLRQWALARAERIGHPMSIADVDELTDHPMEDAAYTVTAMGPNQGPTVIARVGRDVIQDGEVKRLNFQLRGCDGSGPPRYVLAPEHGESSPAGLGGGWNPRIRITGAWVDFPRFRPGTPGESDLNSVSITHTDDAVGTRTTGPLASGEVSDALDGQHVPGDWQMEAQFTGVSLQNCLQPPQPECDGVTYQCTTPWYPRPQPQMTVLVRVSCTQ
jgi:hypothetical protein